MQERCPSKNNPDILRKPHCYYLDSSGYVWLPARWPTLHYQQLTNISFSLCAAAVIKVRLSKPVFVVYTEQRSIPAAARPCYTVIHAASIRVGPPHFLVPRTGESTIIIHPRIRFTDSVVTGTLGGNKMTLLLLVSIMSRQLLWSHKVQWF